MQYCELCSLPALYKDLNAPTPAPHQPNLKRNGHNGQLLCQIHADERRKSLTARVVDLFDANEHPLPSNR